MLFQSTLMLVSPAYLKLKELVAVSHWAQIGLGKVHKYSSMYGLNLFRLSSIVITYS